MRCRDLSESDLVDLTDRIIALLVRRYRLDPDDQDDFRSWVHLKIREREAYLRHEGRSSPETYLKTVIANLARDFGDRRWGRWRNSATARSLGTIATELEERIYRDGSPVAEAISAMVHRDPSLTPRMLHGLLAQLPARVRPFKQRLDSLDGVSDGELADLAVTRHDQSEVEERIVGVLEEAVGQLDAEEQAILRLRYWEGWTIASIAQTLGLPQKPLYRRIEKTLKTLKSTLEARGVAQTEVAELVAETW